LDEGKGVSIQSLWDDLPALAATSKERLGYPTQKPETLLERVILASSNESVPRGPGFLRLKNLTSRTFINRQFYSYFA